MTAPTFLVGAFVFYDLNCTFMQNQKNIDMKKLLFLLLLPFVFACSSDKDNGPSIDYIDNSLIEGKWVFIQGTHTIYMIFEKNIWKRETYHTYDKDLIGETYFGKYKLTKDRIVLGESSKWKYKLNDDMLSIFESADTGSGTTYIPYTKVKE